ncbi:hypothetical protein [Nocardioides zeae]
MWTVTPSPIGDLRIVADDEAVTAIDFAPTPRHPRGRWASGRTSIRCWRTRRRSSRRTSPAP